MEIKKLFVLLIVFYWISFNLSGQVTIGDGKKPIDVAVLEVISTNPSQPKGFRLPQLTDSEVDILAAQIKQLPEEDKLRANGIMVFNTSISCTMVWNGSEFKSLCGDLTPAEITPDCANLIVFPNNGQPDYIPTNYQQATPLDGSTSYISLPVTVLKPGSYDIIITTGNGYSFTSKGNLLDVGYHILKLEGSGTPIIGNNSPPYYDQLSIKINGEIVTDCDPSILPNIPVSPVVGKATYTIECNTSTVEGTYIVQSQLGLSHTIKVQVNVSQPGYYTLTAEAAGMSFSRSGQWSSGETGLQTVTLLSSGKPTEAGKIPITIRGSLASGEVTCEKSITVSYRAMKILGFGDGIYHPGTTTAEASSRAIPLSASNFGTTGRFPTQGITIVNGGSPGSGQIANAIQTHNPDIIVMGYPSHAQDAKDVTALKDFLSKGGVLLAFTESNVARDTVMINAICNSSITLSSLSQSVHLLTNEDHPILNGPFGNVRNERMGADLAQTFYVSSLPTGAIPITTNNTAFVYNNFMWVGDGGFIAGNKTSTDATIYPCKNDINGVPVAKNYSGNVMVQNSILYANALAWAIDYAQTHKQ